VTGYAALQRIRRLNSGAATQAYTGLNWGSSSESELRHLNASQPQHGSEQRTRCGVRDPAGYSAQALAVDQVGGKRSKFAVPFLAACVILAIVIYAASPGRNSSSAGLGTVTTDVDARVKIGETSYLRTNDASGIFIFKSQDAMYQTWKLLKAGADDSLTDQYTACFAPTNTKILVITGEISSAFMSGADHTSDVMVLTGPKAGCRGTVPNRFVQK
jgi:hypothetical protein